MESFPDYNAWLTVACILWIAILVLLLHVTARWVFGDQEAPPKPKKTPKRPPGAPHKTVLS